MKLLKYISIIKVGITTKDIRGRYWVGGEQDINRGILF
jgi:hypothetical protein